MKAFKILLLFVFFGLIASLSYAQRQPIIGGDLNTWGDIMLSLLNVTQTENGTFKAGYNASAYNFNITNNLIVIGNVNISGYLNISGDIKTAGAIYVGGNIVQVEKDSFKLVNYSNEYSNTGFKLSNFTNEYENKAYYKLVNFTSNYDSRADRFGLANYSNEYANTGYKLINYSNEYANSGWKLVNYTNLEDSAYRIVNFTDEYGRTGYKLVNYSNEYSNTGYKLVNFTANYDARSDRFGYGNLSGIGNNDINTSGSLNVSQNVTFTSLKSCDTINTDANGLLTCGSDSGADAAAWNLVNYSNEYANSGYKLANYSTEYSNTGYKLVNYSNEYANSGYKVGNYTALEDVAFRIINWTTQFSLFNGALFNNENLSTRLNLYIPSFFNYQNLSKIGNNDINTSGSLNVSQNVTFTGLKSCDTIDTDANGLLTCGADATGGGGGSGGIVTVLPIGFYLNVTNGTTAYFGANESHFDLRYQIESIAYKLVNFTSAYDSRADRFGLTNYSNEYSNTGYKLVNYSNEYSNTGWKTVNNSADLQNNTHSRFVVANITGGSGLNATIWIGNGTIMSNGSHICIPRC